MAKKKTASGAPLSKAERQERDRRREVRMRRKMLSERHAEAISNSREYAKLHSGYGMYEDGSESGGNYGTAVDNRFAIDIQKMKFCRKPVGFLMNLIFLVAVVLIVLPLIPMKIPAVEPYIAIFAETEPKPQENAGENTEDKKEGEGETTEGEGTEGEKPASAAAKEGEEAKPEEGTDGTKPEGETEGTEGAGGETAAPAGPQGTYTQLSDPVFGWISYIAKQFNASVSLGESPWYDAQISKVETGMQDKFAAILIQAFPVAIVLYLIFALTLTIKTFICWASGDRRIYRHTWIECVIMILLAAIVMLGGFATTVGINAKMEFGGIVNYIIGLFNGAGGFTIGYGLIAMIGLPLVGLILSFFLLEKKLRSREITQPIVMYQYKDTGKKRR